MTFLCSTLLTLIIVPNSLWPSEMPAKTGASSRYMHYIWTISIQIKSERPYIRSGFEPSSIFFGRNVENQSQLNCVNESKWCIRIKMVHTPMPFHDYQYSSKTRMANEAFNKNKICVYNCQSETVDNN